MIEDSKFDQVKEKMTFYPSKNHLDSFQESLLQYLCFFTAHKANLSLDQLLIDHKAQEIANEVLQYYLDNRSLIDRYCEQEGSKGKSSFFIASEIFQKLLDSVSETGQG